MDLASLIGVLIGTGCLLVIGYETSHGHWTMFFSAEGVFAVFGGSISVAFMAMPMQKIACIVGFIKRFMFHSAPDASQVIQAFMKYSEKARRDGLLALEEDVKNASDPFLASGLRMLIDGMDRNTIEGTLRMEILGTQERHKAGKKFFDLLKLYAPGWGLVATLIGQIGMFGQLGGSVEAMGKMLALAVTATMYGTVMANAVAGPIGDKLALRSSEEIVNREMMLQGILSLQAGDNPRITLERMAAFIPHAARGKIRQVA